MSHHCLEWYNPVLHSRCNYNTNTSSFAAKHIVSVRKFTRLLKCTRYTNSDFGIRQLAVAGQEHEVYGTFPSVIASVSYRVILITCLR